MPELILYNANIITMDSEKPHATALSVGEGLVLNVGTDETILVTQTANTKVVDLGGKTIVPGLTDSHGHLRNLGRVQEQVQLFDARSFEEVVERVRANGTSGF